MISYEHFRTGLTFSQVRAMLWVDSDDRSTWKQKSRGCVLWLWRSIKLGLYEEYIRRYEEATKRELEERRSGGRWGRRFYENNASERRAS